MHNSNVPLFYPIPGFPATWQSGGSGSGLEPVAYILKILGNVKSKTSERNSQQGSVKKILYAIVVSVQCSTPRTKGARLDLDINIGVVTMKCV